MYSKRPILFVAFCILWTLSSCGRIFEVRPEYDSRVHELVVLHTNDTHGHPLKFYKHPAPGVGGMPARATLIKGIRKTNGNVLLLDAGDINTGRAESNFFKAEPDILGMNYMGYDAVTFGNHEFDNPRSVLQEQVQLATFPFVCANVKTRSGGYLASPYLIKEFPGFKVAIFGLTTKKTEVISNPLFIKDYVFEDEIEVAKKLVPFLRRKADLIIALTHMGIYASDDRGSRKLATNVKGIDIIVDGHTHTRLESPLVIRDRASGHRTLIVQAWQWGLVLGRLDIRIGGKKILNYNFSEIPINLKKLVKGPDGVERFHFVGQEIEEDRTLLNLLQPYADKVGSILAETIGYSEGTFHNRHARYKETALGDIIADSMLWYTKNHSVDFAIMNAGAIREGLPEGIIRKKLIYEILPFDSTIVVVKLKGSDIKSLFDYVATIRSGEGAFPQVSEGVKFKIDKNKGICDEVLIKNKPLDYDEIYTVATNSFLASGGDGYGVFLSSIEQYDTSKFQRDAFIDYIKYIGKPLKPEVEGRFSVIK